MRDRALAKEFEILMNDALRSRPDRLNGMLGLELVDCSMDEMWAEFSFESKEWCLNPYDGVHGGVICSVFDTAMGTGAVVFSGKFISTTDISVSYLRPMTAKRYIIHVDYTQVGRRMVRCVAKMSNADSGVVYATCMASFAAKDDRAKGIRV